MPFFAMVLAASAAFAFSTSATTGECLSPSPGTYVSDSIDKAMDEVANLQTAKAQTKGNSPKWPHIRRGRRGGRRGHRYYSEEEPIDKVPQWPEEVEIEKSAECDAGAGAGEEQEFSVQVDVTGEDFNDPPNQVTTSFEFDSSVVCCPAQDILVSFTIGPIDLPDMALAQGRTKNGFGTRVFIRQLGGGETEMEVEETLENDGNTISIEATTDFFSGTPVEGTWQIAIVGEPGFEVQSLLTFQTVLERCEV